MEEEGLLRCSVIWDIAITCLRFLRISQLVPTDGCPRSAALLTVVLRCLYLAFGHIVVAKVGDDSVVANASILRIAIRSLLGGYARSDAKFFVVCFLLQLDLVHALRIVLLTGGDVAAILVMAYINNVFLSII
jgi:hypothetical protein